MASGVARFEEFPNVSPFSPTTQALEQFVELESGNYTLSYDVRFYSTAKNESDIFEVLWGGTQLLSMNNNGLDNYTSLYGLDEWAAGDEIWYSGTVEHSLAPISTTSTNLLEFSLSLDNEIAQESEGWRDPGKTTVIIQNVAISLAPTGPVVPTPGAALLGVVGMSTVAFLRRRFHR